MKNLELSRKFAIIAYSRATLENYNPSIIIESNSLEELELFDISDYVTPTRGCTIVENTEEGLIDVFSGEKFSLKSYN